MANTNAKNQINKEVKLLSLTLPKPSVTLLRFRGRLVAVTMWQTAAGFVVIQFYETVCQSRLTSSQLWAEMQLHVYVELATETPCQK